jgi:nucleoid-associated protein YgaU
MFKQLGKSITALVFAFGGLTAGAAVAAQPKPAMVKADAPDSYTVVKGDTLWGIAGRFTDAPWRWPELWDLNKDQIKNPHLIYPGDVIRLDRLSGRLSIAGGAGRSDPNRLSPRVRDEGSTDKAIPSIPASIIEPFLSRPLVVEPDGLDKAPTIVATEDNRVVISAGNRAYVSGMAEGKPDSGWYIYRQGKALVDPDTEQTLGYEAMYLGTARQLRAGDPATVELTSATEEVGTGDKLIPIGKPEIVTYAPHAPATFVKGRIISIYGARGRLAEEGQAAIVALNRGASDGLEVGHVLALHTQSSAIKVANGNTLQTPEERYGLVFVFRVFERVSYALVMKVSRPVNNLDIVQTP